MRYIVRSVDGAEYGPYTRDELQQLVRERRLGPGDFVRRESGRTWSPFDRIAGLSELADPIDEASSTVPDELQASSRAVPVHDPGHTPVPIAPARPRLEAAPEHLDAADLELAPHDAASIALDEPATSTASPPTSPRRVPGLEPARSENPFVAAGLPIDMLEGESIQFVLVQSFADAVRGSLFGAILGHRARMICTDRRAVVVIPAFSRTSMCVAWLDRVDRAGVESRTSTFRMISGVVCLVYAAYVLLASLAGSAAISMLGGGAAGAGGFLALGGTVMAIGAALLGLVLLATARARSVTVGDGIAFPCAAAGPWHLARIDEARMRSIDAIPDP